MRSEGRAERDTSVRRIPAVQVTWARSHAPSARADSAGAGGIRFACVADASAPNIDAAAPTAIDHITMLIALKLPGLTLSPAVKPRLPGLDEYVRRFAGLADDSADVAEMRAIREQMAELAPRLSPDVVRGEASGSRHRLESGDASNEERATRSSFRPTTCWA